MSGVVTAVRTHEFCSGHRVCGHEGQCARLHGHGYVAEFHAVAENGQLDHLGRVIDFAAIKSRLCQWLESNWDHKFLMWESDPLLEALHAVDGESLVYLPFNPTAENLARHLLWVIGPQQLRGTGIRLTKVVVHETGKCYAVAEV